MKSKLKYSIMAMIVIITFFIFINEFKFISYDGLKGNINILSNDENYEYLKKASEKFMEENKKITINVHRSSTNEILERLKTREDANEEDLLTLDSKNIRNLNEIYLENVIYANDIIENYYRNFNTSRINEIKVNKNYLAVPIQSNPQFLMIREDILNQYGYKEEDIRTWEELIELSIDIKNKTNGNFDLFSYDLVRIQDIEEVLYYQGANSSEQEKIVSLIKVSNVMGKGVPLCYLANKENIKWIMDNNINYTLKAIMIPAIILGGNRYVSLDGDNIIVMKSSHEKQELINKFVTFLIDNQSKIDEEFIINEGFFPSSKAFYNNIVVETKFKKISNQRLLAMMSNIANKVPEINDYNKLDKLTSSFEENISK